MKTEIHPYFYNSTVTCSCGNVFNTGATKPTLRVEVCSNCHPFYTGESGILELPITLMDTVGFPDPGVRCDAERVVERVVRAGGLVVLDWHQRTYSPGEYVLFTLQQRWTGAVGRLDYTDPSYRIEIQSC